MPWLDNVAAVLQMWYPGMEDGNATADLLFGDVNPSERLPITFARDRDHYPAEVNPEQYPGVGETADYSEGVFVGYQHFDEQDIEPLFPFGHGLSYTEFAYRDLQVPSQRSGDGQIPVTVTVENVGDRTGKEVVQVYARDHDASVPRPPKELKAYEKVELAPGEQRTVAFTLDEDALSYFDPDAGEWTVDPGEFSVAVGRSAGDIRFEDSFEVA